MFRIRQLIILLAVVGGIPTATATESTLNQASTFTFIFENDLFGHTDEQYTNGIQLGWLSPDLTQYADTNALPQWLSALGAKLPFVNEPAANTM